MMKRAELVRGSVTNTDAAASFKFRMQTVPIFSSSPGHPITMRPG